MDEHVSGEQSFEAQSIAQHEQEEHELYRLRYDYDQLQTENKDLRIKLEKNEKSQIEDLEIIDDYMKLTEQLQAKLDKQEGYIILYDTALDFIRAHNLEDLFEQALKDK